MNEIQPTEKSNQVGLTVEQVLNHDESVFSCLCFGYPHYVIVTCSADSTIRIWDSKSGENLKIFNKHVGFVNDVVKWSHSSFISCGEDGKMYCLSVERPFKILKKFDNLSTVGIQTALKISNEKFVIINNSSELKVISFRKNEVRNLRSQRIHFYPVLIQSDIFENCIYLNVHGKENPIKLIDYESDEVIIELKTTNNLIPIYSIVIYSNSNSDEILCSGDCSSTISFFNMGRRKSDLLEKMQKKQTIPCMKKIVLHEETIQARLLCMTQVFSKYLIIGDNKRMISIIELLEDNHSSSTRKILQKNICDTEATVLEIQYFIDFNRINSSNLKLVCCSTDSSIKQIGISNLNCFDRLNENNYIDENRTFLQIFNRKALEFVTNEESQSVHKVKSRSRRDLEGLFENLLQESYEDFCKANEQITKSDEFEVNLFDNPFLKKIEQTDDVKNTRPVYFGQFSHPLFTTERNINCIHHHHPADGKGILFQKRVKTQGILFRKGDVYVPCYIGDFRNSMKNGKGKLYSKKTGFLEFEGEFKNNVKEGRGMEFDISNSSFSKSSGSKERMNNFCIPVPIFEGVYRNNVKEGMGYQYNKEVGEYVKGTWRNGSLDEKSKIYCFKCPIIPYDEINVVKKHLSEKSILGSGGFGSVYKLKSSLIPSLKNLNKDVKDEYIALKIMKTGNDINIRKNLYLRMKRGVELCSCLDDQSHVLETYGVFSGKMNVGCIMKLCECDVSSLIANGKCSALKEKERILFETAKGISEFHKQGLMHRDLKWGNVLKDFNGDIKLIDFDCTKEDQGKIKLILESQTRDGVGTAFFCAPEVIFEKKYRSIHGEDFRYGIECDIYSFGMMIYNMLMETNLPFHSQIRCPCGFELNLMTISLTEIYSHIFKCKLRPLLDGSKLSKFPNYLIDLMIQCWDNNPFKRPKMEDVLQVFEYERKRSNSRKNYTVYKFIFPKYEGILESDTMLLLNTSTNLMDKIINFLESKFSKNKYNDLQRQQQQQQKEEEEEEEKNKKKNNQRIKVKSIIHNIYGAVCCDKDILKIVEKENCPVLEVEFEDNFLEITKKRERFHQRSLEKEVKKLRNQLRVEREFVGGLFNEINEFFNFKVNSLTRTKIINFEHENQERLMKKMIQKKEIEFRDLTNNEFEKVQVKKYYDDGEKTERIQNEESEGEGEL